MKQIRRWKLDAGRSGKPRTPNLEPLTSNQRGITSVVVVFILVTLLTLIGIGFTKVMNRSLQSSSADAQASAATYAAQSAINDAAQYLQQNPQTSATNCDDLIKAGAPLAEAAKLSADGNTAYTCVLVDPNPTSLFYQNLAPYKSQIIKITATAPLASLLFSWQTVDRNLNQFVPSANGQTLLDESSWAAKKYAPLLRLSLYPIPAGGDLGSTQSGAKTFFLYPQTGGGSNNLDFSSPSGLHSVNCSSKNLGTFAGSADYDCNVLISNLGSANASYFYATLTPYYGQTVVKIKGNDNSNQTSKFKDVQSVVDVTAKSGSSLKRLQARIDSSGGSGDTSFNISSTSNNAPDFGLRVSNTLCKRLLVPPSKNDPASLDTGSSTNCGFSLSGPPPAAPAAAAPAPGDTGGTGGGGGGSNQPTSGGGGRLACIISYVNVRDGIFNGNCPNSNSGSGAWNAYPDGNCWVVTLADVSYRGYTTDTYKDCGGGDASFLTSCPLGYERSSGKCEPKQTCLGNGFVLENNHCVPQRANLIEVPDYTNKDYPKSCTDQGLRDDPNDPSKCKNIETINVPILPKPVEQPPPRQIPPEDWIPVSQPPPSSGGGSSSPAPTPTPTPTPAPAPVIDDFSCGVMHLPLQNLLPFVNFGRLVWC